MQEPDKGRLFTQIVLEVFRTGGLLNVEGDRLTQEFDLTSSRWKILGAIVLSDTPLTVPEIGRSMGQSRQAVQRLVDVMIKNELLVLVENPNHKRAKYVELTDKAKQIYQTLDQKQQAWANEAVSELNEEELLTTLKVVQKIGKQFE